MSNGDPSIESAGEALATPKEPSEGRPTTPHNDLRPIPTTPRPFITPHRLFAAIDSPDSLLTTGDPTTPPNKTAVGSPASPQKYGKDDTSPAETTPIQRSGEAHQVNVVEIVKASTLCQEDLVVGLPSSFRPINRPSKITLDVSEFSDIGTPTKPQKNPAVDNCTPSDKRLPSPSPPTSPTRPSEDLLAFQREYVLVHVIEKLKDGWQDVLFKCGWRLGSPRAVGTRYEPKVDAIRDAALRPSATLPQVADAVEKAMLVQWARCCKRTIFEYKRDFRRDLVDEARQKARAVKQKVLADAMTARPPPPPPTPTPTPSTRKRIASTEADVLKTQERVAQLSIRGGDDDAYGYRYGYGYALPPTPTASGKKKQRVGARNGARTGSPARQPQPQTRRRQVWAPAPPRAPGVVGHIGPYEVTSPHSPGPSMRRCPRNEPIYGGEAMEDDERVFTSVSVPRVL
ncbi:hypothetical protein F4818DRAFT_445016 [Hypoxylon cercidicola]|nr:hypothetical protein F4818DRAFT_445016 [Hypoxylon cercidicola]